jgi:hypothetical protein
MVSPASRLLSFFVLLAVMFVLAYLAGTRIGPVTLTHDQPANHSQMQMTSGARQERQARTAPGPEYSR